MTPTTTDTRPALATRGLAVGVFDLFHVGHLRYLQYARARCQTLVVTVTPDATVFARKKRLPAIPQAERLEIVQGLGWIDEVLLQPHPLDDVAATEAWLVAQAISQVFIGEDWRGSPRWLVLAPRLTVRGIGLSWTPRTEQISSTVLRERILNSLED
jgi:glycerol-3-phosphate cytidylyltransferase